MWQARRSGRLLPALACLVGFAHPALGAQGLATAEAGPRLAALELVEAAPPAPGQAGTHWVALELEGEEGRAAWVFELSEAGSVDSVSSAWLTALSEVTALRVLPPVRAPLLCGGSGPEQTFAARAGTALEPTRADRFSTGSAALAAQGLQLPSLAELRLGQSERPHAVVYYDVPAGGGRTAPLRVHAPGGPALGELADLATPEELVDVRLTSVSSRARSLAGVAQRSASDLGLTWDSARGKSNFQVRRALLLDGAEGSVWLAELSASLGLLQESLIANGVEVVASAVGRYLADAERACAERVQQALQGGGAVAPVCSPGTLLSPVAAPDCEPLSGGALAATALSCGELDELAFVFGGQRPQGLVVSRWSGRIGRHTPTTLALTEAAMLDRTPRVPVVVATALDSSGCGGAGWGGTSGGPDPGGGGTGASRGPWWDDEVSEPYPRSDVECGTFWDPTSCSAEPGPSSGDGCGRQPDEVASDTGDTCAGDGSDQGETCAGDSSSTDGAEGETCAGDSSSTDGAEGETCAGSSSGEGDTCAKGGGGGDDCALRRPRRPPLRVSQLVLAFALVALVWRRSGRPGRSTSR